MARPRGNLFSVKVKDMGAKQRGGRVFMEASTPHVFFFWAIHSASLASVPKPLLFLKLLPTRSKPLLHAN